MDTSLLRKVAIFVSHFTFSMLNIMIWILYKNRALILDGQSTNHSSGNDHRRYLVICDLHIGFEDKFQGAGVSIESNVNTMTEELLDLVTSNRITDLVINGDVKSGIDRISRSEWENVPRLISKLSSHCKITIVSGNHDGGLSHLLSKDVSLANSNGIIIGENLIMHGHTRPLPKFQNCKRIIIGHLHPTYHQPGNPLSGQQVWLINKIRKKRVFYETLEIQGSDQQEGRDDSVLEIIVMPSFNKDLVLAGFSRDAFREERRAAPILRDLKASDNTIVVTLDGEIIGDVALLDRVL